MVTPDEHKELVQDFKELTLRQALEKPNIRLTAYKFKPGMLIKYTSAEYSRSIPHFRPPDGSVGKIVSLCRSGDGAFVQWGKSVDGASDGWWADFNCLLPADDPRRAPFQTQADLGCDVAEPKLKRGIYFKSKGRPRTIYRDYETSSEEGLSGNDTRWTVIIDKGLKEALKECQDAYEYASMKELVSDMVKEFLKSKGMLNK